MLVVSLAGIRYWLYPQSLVTTRAMRFLTSGLVFLLAFGNYWKALGGPDILRWILYLVHIRQANGGPEETSYDLGDKLVACILAILATTWAVFDCTGTG